MDGKFNVFYYYTDVLWQKKDTAGCVWLDNNKVGLTCVR